MALWAHFAAAVGTFSVIRVLGFDDMLRLVEAVYSAKGLTPYVDFGFVYPPGQVWLYGKLLGLQDTAAINAAMDAVNLLLWSICAWQVMRQSKGTMLWLGGTVLFLVGGVMPLVWGTGSAVLSEPLPLLIITILLVMEAMERGPSRTNQVAIVGVAAAGTVFRWDWILGAALLECGLAAALWLVAGVLSPERSIAVRQLTARLWRAALYALAGVGIAVGAIAGYALATGMWADMRLFMFYVPFHILPFRRLPLPMGIDSSRPWLEAVVGMTLMATAVMMDYLKSREGRGLEVLLKGLVLIAPCVALMPYAFGRADEVHLLPLTTLVIVTSLTAIAILPSRAARWLLLTAIVINVDPSLHTGIPTISAGSVERADLHLERLHKLTAECTGMFPRDARSLYVGQASYERFLMNTPVLYLMRPDLRPATPFISDEPGLQNSCIFGSRIAEDLARVPRPLVLVLDTDPGQMESNLTSTMTSCGKIEAAIASMHAMELGTCQVVDDYVAKDRRTFRVMVVR